MNDDIPSRSNEKADFGPSLKQPFAIDAAFVSNAFDHVIAGTSIPPKLHHGLKSNFTRAIRSGKPKLELAALEPLLEVNWTWDAFDYWRGEFAATEAWPYMWKREGLDAMAAMAADQDSTFAQARLKILAHTLAMTSFNARHCSKNLTYFQRYGWRLSASIGCPVEDAVASVSKGDISIGDWRTWPPFFPGDRTGIIANHGFGQSESI